jgi:hypothetical protein
MATLIWDSKRVERGSSRSDTSSLDDSLFTEEKKEKSEPRVVTIEPLGELKHESISRRDQTSTLTRLQLSGLHMTMQTRPSSTSLDQTMRTCTALIVLQDGLGVRRM